MPRVGFETAIPTFERAKTVHALDRAATVIGKYLLERNYFEEKMFTLKMATGFYIETLYITLKLYADYFRRRKLGPYIKYEPHEKLNDKNSPCFIHMFVSTPLILHTR
jgi:hypothetical protein